MNDSDRDTAYRRFRDAVNMNAGRLERWLDSAQSKAVGQKAVGQKAVGHKAVGQKRVGQKTVGPKKVGPKQAGQRKSARAESIGHRSGRRIVALLRKKKSDLTDADLAHMRKVAGYVARHMAQRPSGDVRETRWRYSLMNWGHDPLTR